MTVQDTGTQIAWKIEDVYAKAGNIVALGPLGQYSEIDALLIGVLLFKLLKTPEGMRTLGILGKSYLDNMGKVIASMQHASASNWLTAMMNQVACSNIYVRMGLISPIDHYRNLLWIDHIFGEMLKYGYVTDTVGSLTSLVNATSTTEEGAAGLAAVGKILGGI